MCPVRRTVLPLVAAAIVLAGCTGDDEPTDPATSTATPTATAPEVEVPAGVELTAAGESLTIGDPAAVIFQAGPDRVSTIELAVTKVIKGSMERDFGNFALSDEQVEQEPYYVTVQVTNTGPAALGGSAAPLWALDSTDTYFPPTSLVGNLAACPGGAALPKPFAEGDSLTTCVLFIAEAGTTVSEVQLRPYEGFEPVSWAVPASVERAAERRDRAAQKPDRKPDRKPGDKPDRGSGNRG